jgi:hypothetical protein
MVRFSSFSKQVGTNGNFCSLDTPDQLLVGVVPVTEEDAHGPEGHFHQNLPVLRANQKRADGC